MIALESSTSLVYPYVVSERQPGYWLPFFHLFLNSSDYREIVYF